MSVFKLHVVLLAIAAALNVVFAQQLRNKQVSPHDRRLLSNPAFIEKEGLLVMQAESVPIEEPWKFESNAAGYSGPGYIRFDGNSPHGGDPKGMLSYFVKIETPGKYHMIMRLRKNNPDENGHLGNDCYVRVPGQRDYLGKTTKAFIAGRIPINTWRYFTKLEVRQNVILIGRSALFAAHFSQIGGPRCWLLSRACVRF